jgi:uncharacterized membrane protein
MMNIELVKRFPGRNLAAIYKIIYGRYLGTAISLLYLSYFFLILSLNINDVGNLYVNFFMRDTPFEIFLIIFTCVCIYAVWNGLEIYPSTTAHNESAQNVEVMLYIPLMFILPPLSLCIAKIRKLPCKESTKI